MLLLNPSPAVQFASLAFVAAPIEPTLIELFKGVSINVHRVLLSPYTGQPFFVPSEGLASFLETILANGVKRESENWSMKFSPHLRIEPRTSVLVAQRVNHYTTSTPIRSGLTTLNLGRLL